MKKVFIKASLKVRIYREALHRCLAASQTQSYTVGHMARGGFILFELHQSS